MYKRQVIYCAAYIFIDNHYILLDGDPEKEIIVKIIPKNEEKDNLEKIGKEFINELLTYGFYKKQTEKNSRIREILLQSALLSTEIAQPHVPKTEIEEIEKFSNEMSEKDFIEDPEGIAIPWEEKYGNKSKKDK